MKGDLDVMVGDISGDDGPGDMEDSLGKGGFLAISLAGVLVSLLGFRV